jgi:hypothetical protein
MGQKQASRQLATTKAEDIFGFCYSVTIIENKLRRLSVRCTDKSDV